LRRNLLRPEGSGGALAISSHDGLFCKADSGGPWMWRLTDSDFVMVQYAVYSGSYWGGDVGGSWFETYAVAAALPRALPWIEQTMRSRLPPTLDLIVTERVATGYKYRTYREQPMKQLLVSFSGKGTLATSPMPYSCKTSPCAFRLPPGTAVSVTATAEIGYRFSGWTDCPSPSGNRCDVTLSADKSMSARFVLSPNCTFDAMCAAECTQDCLANGGRDCPRKCERECTICQ
jgi:hypothetical protein